MPRIWSTELAEHAGETVELAGWMLRLRRLSNISFLVLRDGRGTAQVVLEDDAQIERLAALQAESVLAVRGLAVAAPQAPGGVEVREADIDVVQSALEPPPFDLFRPAIRAQLPTILDHAAVSLRQPRRRAYARLAAAAAAGFRETLDAEGFVEIHTPKLVEAATEGGANVFPVDYFGRPAYLAQSPQFYKQIMVGVFERVYEVGPVFRAEPHDTPRHLNEYVSLDAELGFVRDHTTVMALLGRVVAGMLKTVQRQAQHELALLNLDLPSVLTEIPAIEFVEAQALIARETGEDPRGEPDLAPAHERFLGEWAQRGYGSHFLYVTGYPMAKRPFYTHAQPERPAFSNSFDLLFRGLEIATGGQRLHRYEDYLHALQGRGLDPAPFGAYLEAFKHGMPPHGGFGMGLERWVARLAGVQNVRDVTLFPRDINRLSP
ncbi:MAG TPA: aspartate--tRNA(Asn) ligase [Dehalococcoidia bacterium]|jgi:nondiscriminating aspartyl-tRNA synthetase|nr:aspartate--tRNA(Asn) ligase [Dehalococcoidia bacterium]